MASTGTQIGYLIAQAISDNVFVGAILVADNHGMPLEFRHSEPIAATRLQRVLYGDVLEKYILCDVISTALIEKLDRKPDVLVVTDHQLLQALDVKASRVVELIETRMPTLKDFGDRQQIAPGEFLLQVTDTGPPIRVKTKVSAGDGKVDDTADILLSFGKSMNLFEPVSRVQEALTLLSADTVALTT